MYYLTFLRKVENCLLSWGKYNVDIWLVYSQRITWYFFISHLIYMRPIICQIYGDWMLQHKQQTTFPLLQTPRNSRLLRNICEYDIKWVGPIKLILTPVTFLLKNLYHDRKVGGRVFILLGLSILELFCVWVFFGFYFCFSFYV